jgi:hypothetical protein
MHETAPYVLKIITDCISDNFPETNSIASAKKKEHWESK